MLKVENIGKSFGKNEVLKDISFSLNKGEVLAIIGSSVLLRLQACARS